jgi:hypothetical protein
MSFDAEQQRRVQLMMAALANQGTVDELGLGPVRDLIAGVLHPGLSVLHTRAKYLLFVPQIYRSLPSSASPEALLHSGHRGEGRLATQLADHYRNDRDAGRGIIGRNTREHAKQPASVAYWPLLRNLGILRGSGSVTQYCRDLAEAYELRTARSALHSDDEPLDGPDHRWIELPQAGEFTGFRLSADQAQWLRQRFLDRERHVPSDQRSLVAYLLDPGRHTWITDVPHVWNHPERRQFPARTAVATELGRDLDQLVHGLRILYNHLCAQRRPDHGDARDQQLETYAEAMQEWREETPTALLESERLSELNSWVSARLAASGGLARTRWEQTYRFLEAWRGLVSSSDDLLASADAARLVTNRENVVKPGRAKLTHTDRLRAWQGNSGYLRFDYNWQVANRLLSDVHDGLETTTVAFEGP